MYTRQIYCVLVSSVTQMFSCPATTFDHSKSTQVIPLSHACFVCQPSAHDGVYGKYYTFVVHACVHTLSP